jgi:hypothetical protein
VVENAFVPLPFEEFFETTFGYKYEEPSYSLKTPARQKHMPSASTSKSTSKKNLASKSKTFDDLVSDATTAHFNKPIAKPPKPKETTTPHKSKASDPTPKAIGELMESSAKTTNSRTTYERVQKQIAKKKLINWFDDISHDSSTDNESKNNFNEPPKPIKAKTPHRSKASDPTPKAIGELMESSAKTTNSRTTYERVQKQIAKKKLINLFDDIFHDSSTDNESKNNFNEPPKPIKAKTPHRSKASDPTPKAIGELMESFAKTTKSRAVEKKKPVKKLTISKVPLKEQFASNSPSAPLSGVKTKRKLVTKHSEESDRKRKKYTDSGDTTEN